MVRTRNNLVCLTRVNNLVHQRALATPAARRVVAPNVDTLYSLAWLDLRDGPMVLTVPEVTDRYFGFQFLDIYTNTFANIGTQATDGRAGSWAVVPPGWTGRPPGRRPARYGDHVADLGRLAAGPHVGEGAGDVEAARTVQQSATGWHPPGRLAAAEDTAEVPPRAAGTELRRHRPDPQNPTDGGAAFFDELATLLAQQSAAGRRPTEAVDALASIGVTPGSRPSEGTDAARVDHAGRRRGDRRGRPWRRRVDVTVAEPAGTWTASYDVRRLRHRLPDPRRRRGRAARRQHPGRGDLLPAGDDATGEPARPAPPATGSVSRRDELPPVGPGGFWSVTMYGEDNFLVDNPARVYALGDRTEGLTFGADGSLDVYVSADPAHRRRRELAARAGHRRLQPLPARLPSDGRGDGPELDSAAGRTRQPLRAD